MQSSLDDHQSTSEVDKEALDNDLLKTFHDQISAIVTASSQKDALSVSRQLLTLLQEINACPHPSLYSRDPITKNFFLGPFFDEQVDNILNDSNPKESDLENTLISCLEQILILWSKTLQETDNLTPLAKKILIPTCKFFGKNSRNPLDSNKGGIYADGGERYQNLTSFLNLINRFGKHGGFESVYKRIADLTNPVDIETMSELCSIISNISVVFRREFAAEYIPKFIETTWDYLRANQKAWTVASKKENRKIIMEAFHTLLANVCSSQETQTQIETFYLDFSQIYLDAESSESKFEGLIILLGVIRRTNFRTVNSSVVNKFILKHGIFHKIFACFDSILFVKHSPIILKYMCDQDLLTLSDLQNLWKVIKEDPQIQLAVQNGISHSKDSKLKIGFLEYALERLLEIPANTITDSHLDLVIEVCRACKKSDELLFKYISFCWCVLFNETTLPALRMRCFKLLTSIITTKSLMTDDHKRHFLCKAIENLNQGLFPLDSFHMIKNILETCPACCVEKCDLAQATWIADLCKVKGLLEHISKTLKSFIISPPPSKDILMVIKLMELLLSSGWDCGSFITYDRLSILWSIATCSRTSPDKITEQVFKSIQAIIESKNGLDISTEELRRFFRDEIILQDKSNFEQLTKEEFDCLRSIFIAVNENLKNISEVVLIKAESSKNFFSRFDKLVKQGKDASSAEDEFEFVVNTLPCKLEGIDTLWSLIFAIESDTIANKVADLLVNVYTRINTDCNPEIREAHFEYFSQCFQHLESILDTKKHKVQSLRSLNLVEKILDKFDQLAYLSYKPHSALDKGNMLSIFVQTSYFEFGYYGRQTLLKLGSNSSVFNLLTRVAEHFSLQVNEIYLTDTDKASPLMIDSRQSNQTLFDVGIKDQSHLCVKKIQFPRAYLIEHDNSLNPRAQNIFTKWFNEYSDNGKMSPENLASFMHSCTLDYCQATDVRIRETFNRYTDNRDCYLDLNNFLTFYFQACRETPNIVWNNLERLQERSDLKELEKSDQNKFKPLSHMTSIISSHEKFVKVLFGLLEYEEEIALKALVIVNRLPTNPQIFANIVMLKGIRGITIPEKQDWSQILDIKFPCKLLYSINIIEYLLSCRDMSEGNETEDIKKLHSQDPKLQNNKETWLHDFLNYGGLTLLKTALGIIEKFDSNILVDNYKKRIITLIEDLGSQKC